MSATAPQRATTGMPSFGGRNCTRKSIAACDAFGRLRKPPLVGQTVVQSLRSCPAGRDWLAPSEVNDFEGRRARKIGGRAARPNVMSSPSVVCAGWSALSAGLKAVTVRPAVTWKLWRWAATHDIAFFAADALGARVKPPARAPGVPAPAGAPSRPRPGRTG
jgi:hypothetical protein